VHSTRFRKLAAAAAAGLLATGASGEGPAGARWLRIDAPAGVDRAAEALAIDPGSGRLAVGGERGVAVGPLEGPLVRVLTRGPVRDLVFDGDGALLAATDIGLYRIEAPDLVRAERVGTGETARSVRALAAVAGRVVAATDAGVFERGAGAESAVWQRVPGLPFGEARRVAVVADGRGGTELWAAIDGALWSVSEEQGARRVSLPGAVQGEGGPVDLVSAASGELWVVLPRTIAIRSGAGEWRTERLVLPPGALPLRLAAEPGRLWLATDAGLLVATGPAGPWQRTGPPAGHVAVTALTGAGERLVVATAHGLLRHAAVSVSASGSAAPGAPAPRARSAEPTIAQVQQSALRYLALEPIRMRELWAGAGRRGWAPELSVRGDYGSDFDRGHGYDESFVSGETRSLFDRDRSRAEGYGVSLQLSWDLGDVAFNLDRVDVSREARLVIQIRDDVLDEINQLYFERQRVLASLDAPPPDVPEALLRLRAAELASGLDAWTGGWFSEQIAPISEGPAFPAQESSP